MNNLVKPQYSSHALIKHWLLDHGLEDIEFSKGLDWISASTTVEVAEKLLDTEYYVYRHKLDDSILVRASQWSLPLYLHDHVETVQPTTSFFTGGTNEDNPDSRKHRRQSTIVDQTDKSSSVKQTVEYFDGEPEKYINLFDTPKDLTVAEACNATAAMSPLCLRTLYGFLNYTPQASHANGMALVNFLGEFNNRSDIDLFLRLYRPDAAAHDAAYTFVMENINGAINQQSMATPLQLEKGKGKEGNLDAEIMLGLGWPTPFLAYSVAGRPPFLPDAALPTNSNEPFLIWLQYVLEQETLPPVISISYSESEQTVPRSYAERVCRGFAQLGARGVTVLVASGDYGVGRSGFCMSNDGTNSSRFLPSFPGSCPYVTTVGATRDIVPEVVAVDEENDFVTGGGFSNYFARPSYQDQVVAAYVKSLGNTHEGFYNKIGRGYPDISAQGYHYISVWNGTREGRVFDGTSASAPTVAAVVALVNDALLADGKPPMGFLNPWLYSRGHEGFTDIFLGSNEGCNTTGFPARRGCK